MSKIELIQGDCIDELQKLDTQETFDLVIADPPYFKVVGQKWDYNWRTLEDYLTWSEEWIKQVARVTRYGGTLYIFGYFRTLSSMVQIAEKHGFTLRQQIIIDKGMRSVAGRKTSTYKMFPNVTESILFFVKENRKIIKPILKNRATELGLSAKEINDRLGVKSNGGGMWSIYTGKNVCEQFPTKKTWDKLMGVLELDLDYSHYAQTFNPLKGFTDIWTDIEFYFSGRTHPTEKPYKLIERLVLSSSNAEDKILDPFSGTGVTSEASANHLRSSTCIELDGSYFHAATERLRNKGINFVSSIPAHEVLQPMCFED